MNKKHWAFGIVIILNCIVASFGQTNFYEQVSSLWIAGGKTNVLNIAEQRLQQNSNDIAGLILKMEYQVEFLELDTVSNTMQRVIDLGSQIATTNFTNAFPLAKSDIEHLIKMMPLYPTNEIATDRDKGAITNKPLTSGFIIKALQDDGYFQ